jgi:hypothetical protein
VAVELSTQIRPRDAKRTIVRSIRIERSLSDAVEKIAKETNVTPNSLISSALTKFVEWDEPNDRYRFVCVPEEQLRAIVAEIPKTSARELGTTLGPKLTKELLQFRFKRVTLNSFIEYLGLVSKYSGIARCEVDDGDGEWTLTYRHQLGEKWSAFISSYYGAAIGALFPMKVELDVSDSQVVLRWKSLPQQKAA